MATVSPAAQGARPAAQGRYARSVFCNRPAEWAWWLPIGMLCGLLFFHGLNHGDLWRTEGLRAIIAAEFLRSGNWVVPTLYGEPLFTKPPGHYAAIALVSWPFGGVTTWSARLPSALAATVTVCLFAAYFRRQLGVRAGLVAALALPTSFMWLDKVPTAEIDGLQVAWVSAALLCFLRALETEEKGTWGMQRAESLPPAAFGWWLAALLCVAGGVLTKWTAPAFFYGTVVPLLWWRGRLRSLVGWPHLLGVAAAGGLVLAWVAAAVAQTGWHVFYDTVSREALQRLSPGYNAIARQVMAAHHRDTLPAWVETVLHPFVVFGAALPWSAAALVTLRPGFARVWDERGRFLLQALHCWAWPNLLFWSLVPEHAPRHSFPLFPGIAGLAALVWIAWLTGKLTWPVPRLRPLPALLTVLALWLVIKLVFVHAIIPHRNRDRQPKVRGEQLAAAVPPGAVLYLFRMKDECTMFYYGRPVRRLPGPADLPPSDEPLYCILEAAEWRHWSGRPAEALLHLQDEQGAAIVLVCVSNPSRAPARLARSAESGIHDK